MLAGPENGREPTSLVANAGLMMSSDDAKAAAARLVNATRSDASTTEDPRERIVEAMASVHARLATLQCSQHGIVFNPFGGCAAELSPLSTRSLMRAVSDGDLLMPLSHFRHGLQQGSLTTAHLAWALNELVEDRVPGYDTTVSSTWMDALSTPTDGPIAGTRIERGRPGAAAVSDRQIQTLSEIVDHHQSSDWTTVIRQEIDKHCELHYDRRQAICSSPWQTRSIFHAWRTAAQYDRRAEWRGLKNFRQFVHRLPHTPEAALVFSLERLAVPRELWEMVLLCQAFTMSGWCAWAKLLDERWAQEGEDATEVMGLLAMRLAYDAALAEALDFRVQWSTRCGHALRLPAINPPSANHDDSALRYWLMCAEEVALRNRWVDRMNGDVEHSDSPDSGRGRSEPVVMAPDMRLRRTGLVGARNVITYDASADRDAATLQQLLAEQVSLHHARSMQNLAMAAAPSCWEPEIQSILARVQNFDWEPSPLHGVRRPLGPPPIVDEPDVPCSMRTLVMIVAPRKQVARAYESLVQRGELPHGWLSIVVEDGPCWYRYTSARTWSPLTCHDQVASGMAVR
jgi:hypothetical protein